MHLLLIILALVGLTWILVKSTLFKPIREFISKKNTNKGNIFIRFLDSIMNCEGCMGFWAAGVVYVLDYFKIEIALYCFAGSFCSVFMMALLKMVNSK